MAKASLQKWSTETLLPLLSPRVSTKCQCSNWLQLWLLGSSDAFLPCEAQPGNTPTPKTRQLCCHLENKSSSQTLFPHVDLLNQNLMQVCNVCVTWLSLLQGRLGIQLLMGNNGTYCRNWPKLMSMTGIYKVQLACLLASSCWGKQPQAGLYV